jgi:hypothetical protein
MLADERAKLAETWPNKASVARWMEDMRYAGMPE